MQQDEVLVYAVSHAFSNLVENVKEYTNLIGLENLNKDYPQIPWKIIIRFRDKMIHNYGSIDPDLLFEFASKDVPNLLFVIEQILGEDTKSELDQQNFFM